MNPIPTQNTTRVFLGLVASAWLALSACAEPAPATCPQGSRHTTTETGVQACVFDQVRLPDARGLRVYCDNAERGHVDFSWEQNPWTLGYTCPEGWERSDGLPGQSACRSPSSEMTSAAPAFLASGFFPPDRAPATQLWHAGTRQHAGSARVATHTWELGARGAGGGWYQDAWRGCM